MLSQAGVVVLVDGNGVAKLIASCDRHRKDLLHKQGVFRREGKTLSWGKDQKKHVEMQKAAQNEVVNQRPGGCS